MSTAPYRRVIVKLSGEALAGTEQHGIDLDTVDRFAADLIAAQALGVTLGVVVGGGNLLRGATAASHGADRTIADVMGMLATVMNALALESAIERLGGRARTVSAIAMPQVCETYERRAARRHLDDGRIVLFAAGTGNPFFTTDTTAVLRAAEMGAEAVLKATNVDGVYSADPKRDPTAVRYDRLGLDEAIEKRLGVMDLTAFSLARDHRIPIIVFSIREPGAVESVLRGAGRATIVGG
ncbi:UMP kinase [Rhodoplanes elegans]|uniref:Uridylate kinase n=1 Tax=Rhodoplanes elegans TaxID=29408 RepID=A0A327KT47_9BRAD|nr:UMP kinase [Rhodoplanes elegans]MBK5960484.1 UMP kinase [Rhodoplanes elegans]RAI41186.1 UMP kinase [Rhodoplanes elegans]